MVTKNTKSWKQIQREHEAKKEAFKRRAIRAIPYLAGVSFEVVYYGSTLTTWKGTLKFKSRDTAKTFVYKAKDLGHKAVGRTTIYRKRTAWTDYHRSETFDEVTLTMDPAKKKAPKPVPPFDPTSVQVSMKPGHITHKLFLADVKKFAVGKKVLKWASGKNVDDAVQSYDSCLLIDVEQAKITVKSPFATVNMEWMGTTRGGAWHLSWTQSSGGGAAETRSGRTSPSGRFSAPRGTWEFAA